MPGQGGAGLNPSAVRPSRAWYGVAAAILVVGVVAAVLLAGSVVKDVAGVSRFSTNRPVEASLEAGAERTIYTSTAAYLRREPTCRVVDVGTGAPVATTSAASFTLTLGDDEFRSLVNFEVDHDGRYRVSCSADGARPISMAVGPRLGIFSSVARIFAAVAVALVSLALTAATIAVTAVKRNRHRRSRQGAA